MKGKELIIYSVLGIAAAWLVWTWGFCRFYVEPNNMAVITSKIGEPLSSGQILADEGQKGIRKVVLGEGRHFLNPIFYSHEIGPVMIIPPGRVGIVTSKVGDKLPGEEFLADKSQKGIWRMVLGPGKYRMNPYGYNIDVINALSIPIGYAGVITSLSGSQTPLGEFAGKNQKGVQKDILQPGLYYVNPKAYKIDVLEIGVNQVSLIGKTGGQVLTKSKLATQNVAMQRLEEEVLEQQEQKRMDYVKKKVGRRLGRLSASVSSMAEKEERDGFAANAPMPASRKRMMAKDAVSTLILEQFVEFPSRDGFQIRLDMTVEIELSPAQIAWIFSRYGDLPAVVDKIIMPQITSVSRNKGSEYRAKDFIVGEGREKFQNDLTQALADRLGEKKILVHNALIRHVGVPTDILAPIQQASVAIEQNLTNIEKQNTAKKEAELNTEMTMIDQKRREVVQETVRLVANIKADEDKQVGEIRADTNKKVAEIAQETAGVKADVVRKLGIAKADAVKLVEGEKAKGLQLKTKAYGDPVAFGMLELATQLNPNVRIKVLHAGEGTLWTDMQNADFSKTGGAHIIKKDQMKSRRK